MSNLSQNLIFFTEKVLTYRARSKYIKKEKSKNIHPFLDWVGAFLWAAGVVLLLNQYLFQAYVIPSGSMEKTLLVRDRLFVNKFIYGPEILPGIGKLNGLKEPTRSEIIIFENPQYQSKGTLFDLVQRVVFMLTLSVVDLDKDNRGNPAVHFLIKRGISGYDDIVKFEKGELYLKPQGESSFVHEDDFKIYSGLSYQTNRFFNEDFYKNAENFYKSTIFNGEVSMNEVLNSKLSVGKFAYFVNVPNKIKRLTDSYHWNLNTGKYLSQYNPGHPEAYRLYSKYSNGIYVPKGWLLPLGDNRDNSNDGRVFGPIRKSEILGEASFIFWPLNRIGGIK